MFELEKKHCILRQLQQGGQAHGKEGTAREVLTLRDCCWHRVRRVTLTRASSSAIICPHSFTINDQVWMPYAFELYMKKVLIVNNRWENRNHVLK